MNQPIHPLLQNFHDYFSVDLAQTPEQKQKAYEVRYRVYCEELQYEPTDHFPNGQETDAYDDHSTHILITHKSTGRAAGCVRVVGAESSQDSLLPMEKRFAHSLDNEFFTRMELERNTVCEISRLAVDGAFRRRQGEPRCRLGDIYNTEISDLERRTFSLISESGFMAAAAVTQLSGQTNIFALMEPYLCRLLGKSGIYWMRVGEAVNHRGRRIPYYTTTESILQNMKPYLVGFYESIYEQLEKAYFYEQEELGIQAA